MHCSHCPGGAKTAGLLAAIVPVALTAIVSTYASQITAALWAGFAVIMSLCAAGTVALVYLIRCDPGSAPAPALPSPTRVRASVVRSPAAPVSPPPVRHALPGPAPAVLTGRVISPSHAHKIR